MVWRLRRDAVDTMQLEADCGVHHVCITCGGQRPPPTSTSTASSYKWLCLAQTMFGKRMVKGEDRSRSPHSAATPPPPKPNT